MKGNSLYVMFVFLLLACTTNEDVKKIDTAIEAVKLKFAPDRRTARFDVQATQKGDIVILTGQSTSIQACDQLMQSLGNTNLIINDQIVTFPDSSVGDEKYGVVHLSVCNIRSEPKHSAELATQEVMGTKLKILSQKGEWYLVQTPNKYLGWLDNGGLVRMNDTQLNHWNDQDKMIYLLPHGWVYNEPNDRSEVVSDVVAGATLINAEKKAGAYAHIILPDGRKGYIINENVLSLSPGTGQGLVETAKKFLGVPYLWGGTSAKGFDCSGFTKTVFALHDFLLPRDASQQVHVGKLIETDKTWKNLLPGDLLFFGNYRDDGSERITHVAIYLGEGKIIHATGRVKIESLNPNDESFAKKRYETFMRAKRMIENGLPFKGVKKL